MKIAQLALSLLMLISLTAGFIAHIALGNIRTITPYIIFIIMASVIAGLVKISYDELKNKELKNKY